MSDPIAQGQPEVEQQQEAVTQEPAPQAPTQQASNPHEGVQARFNELTAQRYEQQRRADAMEAQVAALTALLAQNQQRPQQEPEIEFADPDAAKAFNAFQQRMQAQLAEMERRNAQMMSQIQFQQVQQQFAPTADQAVQQRAAQLFQAWQRDPTKQGWTPQDAFIYAQGEVAYQNARQGAVNQERQQFNRAATVTPTYAPPPPVAPRGNSLPADFDDLDPDSQLAILSKRLDGKKF